MVNRKKTAQFKWSSQCAAAFDALKQCLNSAPVLSIPDFTKQFILHTGASESDIGAVLSQKYTDCAEGVVAYASRVLSTPECRYCVTRKELLAVDSFVKHFRPCLLGTAFTMGTDHGLLTWLKNFKTQKANWLDGFKPSRSMTVALCTDKANYMVMLMPCPILVLSVEGIATATQSLLNK